MGWHHRLSGIRGIVVASLLAVLTCTAGLGALSFIQLGRLDASSVRFRREVLPAVQTAGQLLSTTEQVRSNQALLLLDLPYAEGQAVAAQIVVQQREITADLTILRSLLQAEHGVRLVARIDHDMDQYFQLSARYDQLLDRLMVQTASMLLEKEMGDVMGALRGEFSDLSTHLVLQSSLLSQSGEKARENTRVMILYGVSLALFLMLGTGWVLNRRLVRPILLLTAAVRRMTEGDIDTALPCNRRTDEIGGMTAALAVFRHAMAEERRLAHEQASVALVDKQRLERRATLGRFLEATVNEFAAEISNAAAQLQQTACGLNANAVAVVAQTETARDHAAEANEDAISMTRQAEDLARSIGEIRRQAAESAGIAGAASQAARRTGGIVTALTDGAQAIGQIVALIDAIAAKTRLLALNAAIEAAHAGDAGRSFSVVASEVKGLAVQTKQATEEIASHIQQMQAATAEAAQVIEASIQTIGRTSDLSTLTANEVEQQDRVVRDIGRSVQRANSGTRKVDSVIGLLSEQTSETGAAASQVLHAAGELRRQASALKQHVGSFLAEARSV